MELNAFIGKPTGAGTIHLERGRKAGITDDEIIDVIMLTQVAKGFDVLGDGKEHLDCIFSSLC